MIGVALLSLLFGLSGAIVPGPLFAVTLYEAPRAGWTAGLWLTVGHMLAEILMVTLLAVGLSRLLQRPAVTRAIAVLGGGVLLYLAWGMAATALAPATLAAARPPSGNLVAQGFLLTVVNPYWYVWWATAGVALIGTQAAKHGPRAWPAFFTGHILADYLWYIAVALLVALGSAVLHGPLYRGLILASALFVAAMGVGFFVHAARGWLQERAVTRNG